MKTRSYLILTAAACLAFGGIHAQTPYVTDGSTLLLYHFDQNSGSGTAPDSSGNGRNAALGAGVTSGLPSTGSLDTSVQAGSSRADGIIGWTDTANPNGQNSFLYNLTDGPFTVEMWIKWQEPTAETQQLLLFSVSPTDSFLAVDFIFSIYHTADGTDRLAVGNNDGPNRILTDAYEFTADDWYHLAVTYSPDGVGGADVAFYVNTAGSSTTPAPFYTYDGDTVPGKLAPYDGSTAERVAEIGRGNSVYFSAFPGQIDEFRLSDVARTQFDTLAVPEPSSVTLMLGSLAALLYFRKRGVASLSL